MDDVIEAVAVRALEYRYKIWGFGEGPALLGVLRAGEHLGRPQWIDAVADLVAPSLHRPSDVTDHLIPVEVLTELARLRPAVDVSAAVARFRSAVSGPVHRPDLGAFVWVDCMHTDGPGLPGGRAAAAIEAAARLLASPSGLFSHGHDGVRPNGVHWGRGQGWALHGLRAVDSPRLPALVTALGRYEEDGRWRTVVDLDGAPVEHSVSAFVAAALPSTPMGKRALAAALDALDGAGGLPVSEATPIGDAPSYLTRATGVFPWGQGPLLLALLEASR
ncbi:glycoside hydrolase family 88 protein [Dactylosporangium sp. AC04546]|uniref:glycoside hydrolase family 88 protein n=1 Tax=Dactylosporangium sp. AC04546 TaxID=2862460 RepID=UPI001EE06BD7|nr:glycoside hydrolase family 88 protein [Dactylosporangium sp. AC04546]WVK85771.1 glycoside hydrolase family 88 protein [Dactylosporangium sp. AC04546]